MKQRKIKWPPFAAAATLTTNLIAMEHTEKSTSATKQPMQVQHNYSEKNGVFFIVDNGKQIATMNYVFAGEKQFIIEHTEVNPEYNGQGLGKLLVKAAVDFARINDLKISPLCPYANAVFKKTPDYKDVLR